MITPFDEIIFCVIKFAATPGDVVPYPYKYVDATIGVKTIKSVRRAVCLKVGTIFKLILSSYTNHSFLPVNKRDST